MALLRLHILLLFLVIISTYSYSQDTTKYAWENIAAEESVEQLQRFKAIYEDNERTKHWDNKQRNAFLHKGIMAAEQLEANTDIVFFSTRLGNHYNNLDSFSQAIRYMRYPIELDYDTISIARAYNRLGYLYFDIGDYSKALEHLFEAVRYGKMLNRGWETYPFGNISNVYKHLEDYDNAIKYTKASMVIDAKAASPEREYGYVYNYTALLVLSAENNQIDSCFWYIDLINQNILTLDTIDNINYQAAINYAHITIADFYIKNDLLDKAKNHLELAKKNETYNKEGLLLTSGKYWLKKRNYNQVKSIIKSFEDLKVQNFQAIEDLLKLRIEYHTAINDLKTVVNIQKELLKTQREKFGDDRLRYGTFANAEFRNLEQQQQITTLENRRNLDQLRSRNHAFIALGVFLLILGIVIFLWQQNRQRKRYNHILERKVAERTKELEQANYELLTFNYIASHDIKEPIRVISGYASLIHKQLPADLKEKFGNHFSTIKRSTKQLYTLVEDFAYYSTLSKNAEIKKESVNLNQLLENVQATLQESIKRYSGTIIVDNLPTIHSSSTFLFTAFKNLVENGLKYNESETPTIHISYNTSETQHQITIRDNGIGIKAQYHSQVFDMFKRLHHRGQYEGTGIGLAIVKLVIEKLDGQVKIESEIGKGTSFVVILPKD